MLQIAFFVDAGYLHAQGSALLAGSAQRPAPRTQSPQHPAASCRPDSALALLARALVADFDDRGAADLLDHVERNGGQLPPDFDRPSLATARNSLARELSFNERSTFREAIREALRSRAADQARAHD